MIFKGNNLSKWEVLHDDIDAFCRILQYQPSHDERHYLLRVQNIENGPLRLPLVMPEEQGFAIIATAMMFRALVHRIPSYLFYEHENHAQQWIHSMVLWGTVASDPLRRLIQVSKQHRFIVIDGIHICHCVGPWQKDEKFRLGKQDIVIADFEDTPTTRIRRICELTEGAILYVPQHHEPLAEHKDRRKASDK